MSNLFCLTELSSEQVKQLVDEYARKDFFIIQEPIKFLNNVMGYKITLYKGDSVFYEKINEWTLNDD